jgi:hypothetical protein
MYSLRVLSAFWLTAAKPAPHELADTRRNRLSLEARLVGLARPRGLGGGFQLRVSRNLSNILGCQMSNSRAFNLA